MSTPLHVLFLCTGNSARSVMAEGLLNQLGGGRFRAFSAGSQPTGRVNPFAIEMLRRIGHDTTALRSKCWDEFGTADAPRMDLLVTVCDNAAGETCPLWPGQPVAAHWGFEDPAAVQGGDEEKRAAFENVFAQIRARIECLLALPIASLERSALLDALRDIGRDHL